MSKELIISITPQETKAAILENDQLVEIHIERDKEHGIVGAICKGRVTKVLPGMQSAFVDIGLERDAFLYVSDFFEDTEEYDKLVTNAEEQVSKLGPPAAVVSVVETTASSSEVAPAPSNSAKYQDRRGRSRRSRRFRLRGRHYEGSSSAPLTSELPTPSVDSTPGKTSPSEPSASRLALLPGESLAKYQSHQRESVVRPAAPEEPPVTEDDAVESDIAEQLEAASELVLEAVESMELENDDAEEEVEASLGSAEALPSSTAVEADRKSAPVSSPELQMDLHSASAPDLPQREEPASNKTSVLKPTSEPDFDRSAVSPAEPPAPFPQTLSGLPAEAYPDLPELLRNLSAAISEPFVSEPHSEATPAVAPRATIAAPAVTAVTSSEVQATTVGTGVQSAPVATPNGNAPSSKIQFRNSQGTPKFFRRNLDRAKRRSFNEERNESESVSSYPLIGDLLKEGQEILVQIAKEPLGTKGARITSHIALPGRYLVYMPTVDHIGVSRKIESDEERQRLKRIILENRRGNFPGGFIVRTAGQGKGEEEFKSDVNFLYALWAEIKSRAEKKRGASFVHRDLNLVQRILRDQLSADFSNIRVDNETEYAAIVEFINRFQPSLVNRVKLYTKDTPIFEEFGVQAEIDRALRNKVWLRSGGYIVIDQAEALVAIDVNTGKYVGKSNKLEDTIVKTNIEASKEIARQIRLRDLGGIIVCDFIDMEDRKNRLKVTQTLEEALRNDKSPSKILQFNDFGLVAITRKRVKQSLMRALCEPCSHCVGSGMVKSAQTVCYEIQGEAKKMAKSLENREITIRVSPEVAKALKTTEVSVIQEIESVLKKDVVIKSDPLLHRERFDIF